MKAFDKGAQTNPVSLDSSSDAADFKDGDGGGRLLCDFFDGECRLSRMQIRDATNRQRFQLHTKIAEPSTLDMQHQDPDRKIVITLSV